MVVLLLWGRKISAQILSSSLVYTFAMNSRMASWAGVVVFLAGISVTWIVPASCSVCLIHPAVVNEVIQLICHSESDIVFEFAKSYASVLLIYRWNPGMFHQQGFSKETQSLWKYLVARLLLSEQFNDNVLWKIAVKVWLSSAELFSSGYSSSFIQSHL